MATMLIVDDDYFIREVAVSIVEECGHVVLSADGIDDAMVHLSSIAKIDALITDIHLGTARLGAWAGLNSAIRRVSFGRICRCFM